jgi:hypothetical protein
LKVLNVSNLPLISDISLFHLGTLSSLEELYMENNKALTSMAVGGLMQQLRCL